MKRLIIVISVLLTLCIAGIVVNTGLNTINEDKLSSYYLKMLNGDKIKDIAISEIVELKAIEYQNNSFISDDILFCLLDDVDLFEEMEEDLKDKMIELENNPFIADLGIPEKYEKYFLYYYPEDVIEKDARVIEKDNKYYIYQRDLKFDKSGYDMVSYGVFKRAVSKKEVSKLTYSQAQEKEIYEFVGVQKLKGQTVFVYFNNETKETVEIKNTIKFGIVFTFEMVGV